MNSSSISNINSDVEINGSLTFKGELTFDGQLNGGNIVGEVLIVGPKARIQGNIQSEALTLHGSVTGDVLVVGKCELKGSAHLNGSLTTNRLVMDEGASLMGKAEITPDAKKRALPPTPPAK
jgi:cytoskeletal protein CcmA (bactofilin family)